MASSSGTSETSSLGYGLNPVQSSGSEPDIQNLMDQKKQKRMISNRESARRSRKRKQKHLDDLTAQLSQLRKENNEIMSRVSINAQLYMSVEAENHVLRVQVAELSHHLQSLNDIIAIMYPPVDPTGCGFAEEECFSYSHTEAEFGDELVNNSLSYLSATQPILACADMFMY